MGKQGGAPGVAGRWLTYFDTDLNARPSTQGDSFCHVPPYALRM